MLGTAIVAVFLKVISQRLYPDDVALRDAPPSASGEERTEPEISAPLEGYLALVIFVVAAMGLALLRFRRTLD